MIDKFFTILLLLVGFFVCGQPASPVVNVLFVMDKEGHYVEDALVIINGKDTLKTMAPEYLGYAVPYVIPKKFNVKVTHADYETLVLDSVSATNRIYLLKKGEPYYISNGMKVPYRNRLKYLAVMVEKVDGISAVMMKDSLSAKLPELGLEIAQSFVDTFKLDKYKEDDFGCVKEELKRIFWINKVDGHVFGKSDTSLLVRLRTLDYVSQVVMAEGYFSYLSTSEFIVSYKCPISDEIESEITVKYGLKKKGHYKDISGIWETSYEYNGITPPNDLLSKLMYHPNVEIVGPLLIGYDTCN